MYILMPIYFSMWHSNRNIWKTEKIYELTTCWDALNKILSMNITVLDTPMDFNLVMNICREYKLLTRDALHVSVMRTHGITQIATNDGDFKKVPEISVLTPS
ncbi:MAG: PIN domain protein [Candidatus Methanoperedens nitroreducens]|uniref:PIN domain protein n=2 Tax=Candidatus Methanoperedens TaxID=1392997 RepID=A0A0P8A7J2_9EURY|nr:MAG: PIN domain-containing protein [Candidatus Methanoperedens sp.]KPQ44083.1 MAG: PIN domain protein [Candidatus Methanoperedens sp. BLZ1]